MVGKKKRAILNCIKEPVWNKIQGWKEKPLSQAGREVLLKSIVQAIPTFAISYFKLTLDLCRDIENMICKFGGDKGEIGGKLTGKVENHCVNQRLKADWALESWQNLVKLCLQNRFGG